MLDCATGLLANLLMNGFAFHPEAQAKRVGLLHQATDRFIENPWIECALDRDDCAVIGDRLPGKHDLRQPHRGLRRRQGEFRAYQFSRRYYVAR